MYDVGSPDPENVAGTPRAVPCCEQQCPIPSGSWLACTQARGHSGPHRARGYTPGTFYAQWPNAAECPPQCLAPEEEAALKSYAAAWDLYRRRMWETNLIDGE